MQFLLWTYDVLWSRRQLSSPNKNRAGKQATLRNIFPKPKILTHTAASDNSECRQMLSSSSCFPNSLSMLIVRVCTLSQTTSCLSPAEKLAAAWNKSPVPVQSLWRCRKDKLRPVFQDITTRNSKPTELLLEITSWTRGTKLRLIYWQL